MTNFNIKHTVHVLVRPVAWQVLSVVLLLSCLGVVSPSRAALPELLSSPLPLPVDTAKYRPYSYVRFISEKDSVELSDEEFYDMAGKVIFPINKYTLPKRDSLIMQLKNEVFPLINADSLELVYMMLRGAASPEGPTRWNKFLGEKRAEALLDFMKQNITVTTGDDFDMEINIEDYRTLLLLMRRRGDKDYGYVKSQCDQYLPKNQIAKLKYNLRHARQGTLWLRLFREYFHLLRAARVILFFRQAAVEQKVEPVVPPIIHSTSTKTGESTSVMDARQKVVKVDTLWIPVKLPRREVLSVKSNLLFDVAYVPGYDRWCPIPNVAIEYYPLHGHFTYGASFDFPWWQHYHQYKYFQIRNYQLETRYYLRSGDIAKNRPGEGAAFRGLYLQAYAHAGLYSISFSKNRGWEGEGLGGGIGLGYVMPLGGKGHWRLEFAAQAGFFTTKYDPYQYGNPLTGSEEDDLYYYKWTDDASKFKRRQYRFNWLGPTRVGITLTYDLLYRRLTESGVSLNPWEYLEKRQLVANETSNETKKE